MSARRDYGITGLPPLDMTQDAIRQFGDAWQLRNGTKLKAAFVDGAIRQSLRRARRDQRHETGRRNARAAQASPSRIQLYRDAKTNVVFEVDVGKCAIVGANADTKSRPTLYHPDVGFVTVTEHASGRFRERYLDRFVSRKPTAFDAHEFMWESFGRAERTVPRNAEQRRENHDGRPASYFLDAKTGLRYIVHQTDLVLLTVEIPGDI